MIIAQGSLDKNVIIKPSQNIISLVPSITWLLFDLQLQKNIKGITKFCKAENNQHINYIKIGGTKNPDLQRINELGPDLILANLEENRKEDIEELSKNHLVYLSDIKDLNSMYQMIEEVSKLTGSEKLGMDFISQIRMKHQNFYSLSKMKPKIHVAYLIWKEPYMTIGSDTFIHYMLDLAGLINVFHKEKRYPTITQAELLVQNPELILLSSEPFRFTKKHLTEFNPINARLVDGRMFSWYGSFILQSFEYLNAFKNSLNNGI